jgi:hypothetical protein
MSITELCPDDLLLAARQGDLTALEDAKLAFHLQRCARCRAELEVGRGFDAVLGAQPGDDEMAMGIASRLTERPRQHRWAYALAAGVLLSGSVATAAVSGVDLGQLFRPTAQHRKVANVALPVQPRALPAPATAPTAPAASITTAAPPSESATPSLPLRSSSASAPELFREANSLRSQGKGGEAQKKYRELQARFPGSTEAKVSLVSLARLELGSQPAAALRHFDAYLAQSAHRTLSEEALFGRASALGRLGRRSEERAAWQELVARFPASVYTPQAEARLSKTP